MAADIADRSVEKRVEAGAWGAVFVWIGIALLAHVSWDAGLIGVGVAILAAQLARRAFGIKVEGFWVAVGCLFVVGGVWGLVQVRVGLVPVLCIIAGLALFVRAVAGRRQQPRSGPPGDLGRRDRLDRPEASPPP
jgi:hypothetical protein